VFIRYTILNGWALTPDVSPQNGLEYPSQDQSSTLSWSRVINPRALNEFRAGFNKQDIPRANQGFAGPQEIGGLTGFLTTGGGTTTSQEVLHARGGSWSLLDNFAYTLGRHSLRMGMELQRFRNGRANYQTPVYEMNTLADLLAGKFTNVTVTIGNDMRRMQESRWGFYIQDDFRVNKRLTLNLGMRYEYYAPVKEASGLLFNVVSDPFGPFRPKGEAIWESDKNNFGPRVGLAWDVGGDSKTVLRLGGGVFYAPNTYREVTALVNPPDRPYTLQLAGVQFPTLRYPVDVNALDLSKFPVPTQRTIFDPHQRSSYSEQWSGDFQRQITKDLMATVGYTGNHGVKLLVLHWLNELNPATGLRPVPTVGRVSYQEHSGMSNYHALQFSLKKRFSSYFSFNGHYTWSKALEQGGVDAMTASSVSTVQSHMDVRGSRGPSVADIHHVFSLDYNVDIPLTKWFRASSPIVRRFTDGWQLLGITAIRSGSPILITSGRDNYGLGTSTGQRPDRVAGVPILLDGWDTSKTHQYINAAAFADPCALRGRPRPCGVFGNLAKYPIWGPGLMNTDLSVFKTTKVTESATVQFRAEFYNVFNHVNFSNAGGSLTSATFGQITAAARSREIQFALKVMF
jgi:hypothetical protein